MKNLLCLLALLLCTTVFAQPQQVVVGVSGNGYVTRQQDGARITQRGVTHWTNPKSIVSIYFYLHQPPPPPSRSVTVCQRTFRNQSQLWKEGLQSQSTIG